MTDLLMPTEKGFYCPPGDFYIDPWQPVPRAVITHVHADHYTPGCGAYTLSAASEHIARVRLGPQANLRLLPYRTPVTFNGVTVSLHPAGHILGSAQVRVEHQGEVWVLSGDYKTDPDPTCAPFEPVACDVFITEATFGLPIYHWPPQAAVFRQINAWWQDNQSQGRASILYGYALGKAQRLLMGVDPSIGPIYTHGAVESINDAYRTSGVDLPPTAYALEAEDADWSRALIVAPPSARGTRWLTRFGPQASGYCSGWMTVRGTRRRWSIDRGFVISDHVDWAQMLGAVRATGAQRVLVTHGYTAAVARWLREHGLDAAAVDTRYRGEDEAS
ncbi:MAG: ligase-associated DNA damage response exonuclease [Chloroflexi bacterium]|nr:ligase-associated DNA damage response exonuclease [Chloroflexota bacterium]